MEGRGRAGPSRERSGKIWVKWKENLSDKDDYFPPADGNYDQERTTGTINILAVDKNSDIAGITTTSGLAWKIPVSGSDISINPSTKTPEFSSNLGVFFSSLFGSLFMFGSQCIYFGNLDSPSSKNLAGTEVAFCKPLALVALAGSLP